MVFYAFVCMFWGWGVIFRVLVCSVCLFMRVCLFMCLYDCTCFDGCLIAFPSAVPLPFPVMCLVCSCPQRWRAWVFPLVSFSRALVYVCGCLCLRFCSVLVCFICTCSCQVCHVAVSCGCAMWLCHLAVSYSLWRCACFLCACSYGWWMWVFFLVSGLCLCLSLSLARLPFPLHFFCSAFYQGRVNLRLLWHQAPRCRRAQLAEVRTPSLLQRVPPAPPCVWALSHS